MKTILLPFYDDDVSQHALALCASLVEPVAGYVEGLFVLRLPPIGDPDNDVLAHAHFEKFDDECRSEAARSRQRFETCAANLHLPVVTSGVESGASAGWHEATGTKEQVIGSRGRLFDLIVMGREFGRPWLEWKRMLEAALFESGRPVLLAPGAPVARCGENIAIAWNASTETARTVAFAMPFLLRARAVSVISIEGWGVPGPTGEEFAAYLRRAGVPASARHVPAAGRSPGAAILDACSQGGADLLLKGAYTQSRLRQLIFGGATRHILAEAKIPVFLAH